jgi:hypothetical protein
MRIGPPGHCERSLRSNLPVNEGDCFVLKDAGAIAHYAPRNDILTRRGVAAGMGNCPVLKIAARRSLRAQFAKQSPAHVGDCFVAHYAPRNDILTRRGAAAGVGNCPGTRNESAKLRLLTGRSQSGTMHAYRR